MTIRMQKIEETQTGQRATAVGVNTPGSATSYGAYVSANVRAGVGYGNLLIYGKAGLMAAHTKSQADLSIYVGEGGGISTGLSAGAGVEFALTENVSVFGEYQHTRLSGPAFSGSFVSGVNNYDYSYTSQSSADLFKIGANFRF